MNTAYITDKELTLTLNGQNHTQKIASKDEGRAALVSELQQRADTDVEVAVYVQGEDPIGLAYKAGKFSQIPVPTPEQSPSEKTTETPSATPQSMPVLLDEEDDDALDMPVINQQVVSAEPEPQHTASVGAKPESKRVDNEALSTVETPVSSTVQSGHSQSKPSAAAFYSSKPATTEEPAKKGWRGFLNSFGLSITANADEIAERKARRAVQRGLKSHKTIMVVNLKGGAGKTTIAYLLSSVLGRVRGGTVLAWDNNENRGTLAYRSPIEPNTTNTAIDLLSEAKFFENSGQSAELINFVRPQGENKFDILASQHQGSDKPVINGDGFLSLHQLLRSFYRMIVVDTGNASNASTWQAAAKAADELVIVCTNAEDSAQTAAETIDALIKKGYRDQVENSVAVVIDTQQHRDKKKSAEDKERLGRIKKHLLSHVRTVHVMPWEDSLEHGGAIEWERLSPKTQRVLLETTASVIDGL